MLEKEKETLPDKEYDYLKTASSQDCTGLIPAAPASNAELESYEDLYPFLPQAVASYNSTIDNATTEMKDTTVKSRVNDNHIIVGSKDKNI